MTLQIIGTQKSKDTRKAVRFFKDRAINFQFVDLTQDELSAGVLDKILKAIPEDEIIDTESKSWKKRGMAYMEFDTREELLEDPLLMKMPVIRGDKGIIAGFNEKKLKEFANAEKQ